MAAATASGGAYEFAQPPAAVPATRGPYREPPVAAIDAPSNIMWDRRVVRGNTYASQTITPSAQAELEMSQKRAEARRKQRELDASRRARDGNKPRTPEPVDGRRHMDAQTDKYLEELSDHVPGSDGATQTEPFMDRPPTPIFVPAKVGVDKFTQIEGGDLFDFDAEVEPILEVLVGKTLENALMEVHEDIELENIRARQREFEQIRNEELAEVQRLEAEVKRKDGERRRRVAQEKDRVAQEESLKQKVSAASFARQHLSALMDNVFDQLVSDGHFYDPLTREVEEKFLPSVYERVTASLEKVSVSGRLVDDIIHGAVARAEAQRLQELERVRLQREAEEKRRREEEAARLKAEEEAREKARLEAEAAAKAEEDAAGEVEE